MIGLGFLSESAKGAYALRDMLFEIERAHIRVTVEQKAWDMLANVPDKLKLDVKDALQFYKEDYNRKVTLYKDKLNEMVTLSLKLQSAKL